MRIRKQARILAPSIPPSAIPPNTPPTLVCELNLSPWDVIDFSLPVPSHNEYQVDLNDNHTCNGIKKESGYTSNSTLASLREQYWEEIAKKVGKEEVEEQRDKQKRLSNLLVKEKAKKKNVKAKKERDDYIVCIKTNGKTWRCKNEAKEGQLLCEHHFTQQKSYRYNYGNIPQKSLKLKAVPKYVKKRPRVPSSPTDFYYYSGFGPLWGRNRANETKEEDLDVSNMDHSSSSSSVNVPDIHVHDHDDSDDDYEENKGSRKRKRIQKPIKERSLKSLFKPIYSS